MNRLLKRSGQRFGRWPKGSPQNEFLLFQREIITPLEVEQDLPPIPDWVKGESWREILAMSGQTPEQYWRAVYSLSAMKREVHRRVPEQVIERVRANGRPAIFAMADGTRFEKLIRDEGLLGPPKSYFRG